MGSASSKFRKHLQSGDEVQALQLYRSNAELRKALDPNCSYGDSHQHETPLHLAALHGMQTLLGIFLFNKGGNPNKTNARRETCLHCVCMEPNAHFVHVCKRRAECIGYLLKWRGATLSEGQVEKIDMAAQDESLNTALHYAAASGLTQCVEILIQHGAPLFMENEDHLTPCDTAERNGHAQIALYLESKMVFSNEEEPCDEDDDVSMPPMEEYSGLRPQDLQEAKDQLLVETADMLSVPLFTAEALLRNHEWSRETLLEAWMTDPVVCCEKCGVTPPSTLFSDKPQVQENLTSPLPSPLHANPMPIDAECDICANTFRIAEEPVHMTCTHRFCKECWERYLNVKIQEGDAHHITCPAFDCTMLVPVDIIEDIVSRDMALRYLQFDIKAFVDSNPDMKWCPYPGCGRAVKLPGLDLGTGQHGKRSRIPSDTSRGVDCGSGHYFCWECPEESHEPCSCQNWSQWFQKIAEVKPETLDGTEQETESAANCLWLVTNSKPCPNCKSPIQKNEGCNHMKCSKCKFDFCWVCLEQWKRHNSSTGGYFKCNRYQVVKKVEEQSAQLLTEAEDKNKSMQELNRFVHYYTRFKNHENSYKLEEPLLKTTKDKMMKLAEAVTDNATAHAETKFVEDAVQQLLKARRVLKCSYVYGYYLEGPGYKKIVFECMQTELEEATEILSQMVNRLYLRTPRRKIIEQATVVQRKRLEFIMAISKGLVPPETPPSARKGRKKRKFSGDEEDDDLRRAIVASIQEVDPASPWIKDASGRHTNVAALLEWPSDDSGDSEGEGKGGREGVGKCHREGCNKLRCRNPHTKKLQDYCSRWCSLADAHDANKDEGLSEIALDEHMELLRALEMSRLQYLRDSGLLHVPDLQQSGLSMGNQTGVSKGKVRPRSNSAGGQEVKKRITTGGLSVMEELGIELQRFQELSSGIPHGEKEEREEKKLGKSSHRHHRKLSQSSRFNESGSTVVTRVPNKSVEDLYCLDTSKSSPVAASGLPCYGILGHPPLHGSSTLSMPSPGAVGTSSSASTDSLGLVASQGSQPDLLTPSPSRSKSSGVMSSMFGAIKDISVSNIHQVDSDKTKNFLTKDLAAIFASWDLDADQKSMSGSTSDLQSNATGGGTELRKKLLNTEREWDKSGDSYGGKSSGGKSLAKGGRGRAKHGASEELLEAGASSRAGLLKTGDSTESKKDGDGRFIPGLLGSGNSAASSAAGESWDMGSAGRRVQAGAEKKGQDGKRWSQEEEEVSLLKMAENLLLMTADVRSCMKEVERGIRSFNLEPNADMDDENEENAEDTEGQTLASECMRERDEQLLHLAQDPHQPLKFRAGVVEGASDEPLKRVPSSSASGKMAWVDTHLDKPQGHDDHTLVDDDCQGMPVGTNVTGKPKTLNLPLMSKAGDASVRKTPREEISQGKAHKSKSRKSSRPETIAVSLMCGRDSLVHDVKGRELHSSERAGCAESSPTTISSEMNRLFDQHLSMPESSVSGWDSSKQDTLPCLASNPSDALSLEDCSEAQATPRVASMCSPDIIQPPASFADGDTCGNYMEGLNCSRRPPQCSSLDRKGDDFDTIIYSLTRVSNGSTLTSTEESRFGEASQCAGVQSALTTGDATVTSASVHDSELTGPGANGSGGLEQGTACSVDAFDKDDSASVYV